MSKQVAIAGTRCPKSCSISFTELIFYLSALYTVTSGVQASSGVGVYVHFIAQIACVLRSRLLETATYLEPKPGVCNIYSNYKIVLPGYRNARFREYNLARGRHSDKLALQASNSQSNAKYIWSRDYIALVVWIISGNPCMTIRKTASLREIELGHFASFGNIRLNLTPSHCAKT